MGALVAQLDRVFGYEPKGCGFDSCLAHQILTNLARYDDNKVHGKKNVDLTFLIKCNALCT